MKTNKTFFTAAFAVCALCACSSGADGNDHETPEKPVPTGKLPITISTSVSGVEESRVTDYAFEAGDEAGPLRCQPPCRRLCRTVAGAGQPR